MSTKFWPLMFLMLSSCFIETAPEEEQKRVLSPSNQSEKEKPPVPEPSPYRDACRLQGNASCISGQVIAAPALLVDGVEYFDAEEFGRQMGQHVQAQLPEVQILEEDRFEVIPGLTNDNFLQGFKVFLKGEKADSAMVNAAGHFHFSYLPSGMYDVRAQKRFKMKLIPAESVEENSEPRAERTLCLTLYSSLSSLVLDPQERRYHSFDSFRLSYEGDCQ